MSSLFSSHSVRTVIDALILTVVVPAIKERSNLNLSSADGADLAD